MKILEINKFHFAKGGADKHFLDLIELLKSKGHDVAVFSMLHPKNRKSNWEKYFVSTVGYTDEYSLWQKIKGLFRMFYSFEAKIKINKLLDDFKPDIIHIHNIYHQLSPAILFEIKKRGIPVVMTIHDYKLINPNYNLYLNGGFYGRCKNGRYYECFLDKCVKNSYLASLMAALEMYWHNKILKTYEKNIDLYITPSDFVKNILVEREIDSQKITVMPHFIKLNNPLNTPILPITGIANGYALYFGRISKEKGVDKLIEIFSELGGIKLYLAGALENNFSITESKNIKYLGYLNQNELPPYIKGAKFIVSGSKLPETFGLIALEANACGKPFIGFKAGAYPEIIENNANGALVDTEEEMKNAILKIKKGELAFNEEKIEEITREKFDSEKYYQKISDIFVRLTADHQSVRLSSSNNKLNY